MANVKIPARNTIYHNQFNEDWRKDGARFNLDGSAARALMIIESYCDGYGMLYKHTGNGYPKSELQTMLGLDYRKTIKALVVLKQANIIKIDPMGVITIKDFQVNNNGARAKDIRGTRKRSLLADQIAQNTAATEKLTNAFEDGKGEDNG